MCDEKISEAMRQIGIRSFIGLPNSLGMGDLGIRALGMHDRDTKPLSMDLLIDEETMADILRRAKHLQGLGSGEVVNMAEKFIELNGRLASVQSVEEMLRLVKNCFGNSDHPESYFKMINILKEIIEA